MNRIIEVVVSPTGGTKIETKGFTGSACQQASESLERALGIKQTEKLTAEFYGTTSQQQQEHQA